jgi:hypothetical protein
MVAPLTYLQEDPQKPTKYQCPSFPDFIFVNKEQKKEKNENFVIKVHPKTVSPPNF